MQKNKFNNKLFGPRRVYLYFTILAGLIFLITFVFLNMFYSRKTIFAEKAVKALINIHKAEIYYWQYDLDLNGVNDFWVGDLLALEYTYYQIEHEGSDTNSFVNSFYYADLQPLQDKEVIGDSLVRINDRLIKSSMFSYYNYYFQVMKYDSKGDLYNKGDGKDRSRFAFIAVPGGRYGRFPVYIMNQNGFVFCKQISEIFTSEFLIKNDLLKWPEAPLENGWELVYEINND